MLKKMVFLIFAIAVFQLYAAPQNADNNSMRIAYQLSWEQPNTHYYEMSITVENPPSTPVPFRIPAWRPGRYIIQNYSRNIIEFEAHDTRKQSLTFKKSDKDTWIVQHSNAEKITVSYKYYAKELDGGGSYLDDSEAYINPVNLCMYIPGYEKLPVSIQVKQPRNWKLITAMPFDKKQKAYLADNYHELADNPIVVSPTIKVFSFKHQNATFDIAIQGEGNYNPQKMVEDVRKIVVAQTRIMKILPVKRYVFLYHFLPTKYSHGVEHKNSTSIVLGPADFQNAKMYNGFLSITSHEFFHVWNVERIRPAAIYHPDYSKEAYTRTMWFFEGGTSYYTALSLLHGDLKSKEDYYKHLEYRIQRMLNNPGDKITSAAMASHDSWVTFNGAPPLTNVSFYNKGAVVSLMLDLEIRHRTRNQKSLNDLLQYLYQIYAVKNQGMPENGIQLAAEKLTGTSFTSFFNDYVNGKKQIDYKRILGYAGLNFRLVDDPTAPAAYLGCSTTGDEKETRLAKLRPQSPAIQYGLMEEDVLVAVNGKRIHHNNFSSFLKQRQPGEKVSFTVFRRGNLRQFEVTLGKNQAKKPQITEKTGGSRLSKKIRTSWLNGK